MFERLLVAVWERVTGRPYYTVRRASVEFGLPPAARHADELAGLSGEELDRRWRELKARRNVAAGSGRR